jgi:hypothetical protein
MIMWQCDYLIFFFVKHGNGADHHDFLLLFSQQVPKHASLLVDNLIYKTYVNDNVPMRLPAFFYFYKT